MTQQGYNAAVGKAKLLRGLAYLYLVQLWGEVPVFTENGGNATERKDIDEVYNQIVDDLTAAESLLNDYNGDPVTPSKQAAQASWHVPTSPGATTLYRIPRCRI